MIPNVYLLEIDVFIAKFELQRATSQTLKINVQHQLCRGLCTLFFGKDKHTSKQGTSPSCLAEYIQGRFVGLCRSVSISISILMCRVLNERITCILKQRGHIVASCSPSLNNNQDFIEIQGL